MKLLCVVIFLSFSGSIHSGLPTLKFGKLLNLGAATSATRVAESLLFSNVINLGTQLAFNLMNTTREEEDEEERNKRLKKEKFSAKIPVKTDETDDDEEEEENSLCVIKVHELPSKHPNFIQSFDIITPLKGFLTFGKKESFQVDCVQSTLSNGGSIKNIVCDGNNKYKMDGKTVDLSAFNTCKERIKVIEVPSKPCLGGVMTDMVFKLPKGYFKLYSACSDLDSLSTIYVHYKLYGRAFDRSPIVRDGSYFQGGSKSADLYCSTEEYHRGHLMPYADAIYPAWRAETNHYKNVKPQIPTLNSGAWKTLEQTIRNKAIGTSGTFDVYTGGFDLKGYLNDAKKIVQTDKLWYKMVINNIRGIVFIACNDDQSSCHTQLEKICTNKCMEIGWLTPKAQNKIICCSINDFYASGKIAVIPGTEKVTADMLFYQN